MLTLVLETRKQSLRCGRAGRDTEAFCFIFSHNSSLGVAGCRESAWRDSSLGVREPLTVGRRAQCDLASAVLQRNLPDRTSQVSTGWSEGRERKQAEGNRRLVEKLGEGQEVGVKTRAGLRGGRCVMNLMGLGA